MGVKTRETTKNMLRMVVTTFVRDELEITVLTTLSIVLVALRR